LFGTQN